MTDRVEKSVAPPERTVVVLGVGPLPADRLLLRELRSQRSYKLHEASTCRRALALLRHHSVPVLLSERDHAEVPASGTVAPLRIAKSFSLTAVRDQCSILDRVVSG